MSFFYEKKRNRKSSKNLENLLQNLSPQVNRNSTLQPKEKSNPIELRKTAKGSNARLQKTKIRIQVFLIQKLGNELLAKGAYLDVIKHFTKAADTFYESGYENEALIFLNRVTELKKWVVQRDSKLKLLKKAKLRKNSLEITSNLRDLIDLSQKLNAFAAVERYSTELEQYQSTQSRNIESNKVPFITSPLNQQENKQFPKLTSSLRSNIQNFAINNLMMKRDNLEKRAKTLKDKSLFLSAATLYEKCIEISQQLIQLGRSEEKSTITKFQNYKDHCFSKISQNADDTSSLT